MEALPDGWFQIDSSDASAGTLYQFRIDGNSLIPDPASRFQPSGIHGASQVVDPAAFDWQDHLWQGRDWEEAVIYELHVGAFSPEGTFAGVEARLDYLAELGITAIELMPVHAFPGKYNWGYDGVLIFAPDNVYGSPDDLKQLIRQAHLRGIMVFLDVVYNHFGNEGNYLYVYARKAFFREDIQTPWGPAINFDGPGSRNVRDFFVHNALYWLEEYQLDGLRFDAVHGIHDTSQPHILVEIAEAVAAGPGKQRQIHLILENDRNEARFLCRRFKTAPKYYYTAQWNDDFHHALHVILTEEKSGYYIDYADNPLGHLARCLTEGFAYQGERSLYRDNECRGEASRHLPPTAFVSFLQNHDQVGNRALGDRLRHLAGEECLHLAAALLFLSPFPPLLFMGEEFCAATPFLYFCDFTEPLAAAVRTGRRQEFSRFSQFSDPELLAELPDPCSPESFRQSCLCWSELTGRKGKQTFALYRTLIALRAKFILPRLKGMQGGKASCRAIGARALDIRWILGDASELRLLVNFANARLEGVCRPDGEVLYESPATAVIDNRQTMAAQSILCLLGDPAS